MEKKIVLVMLGGLLLLGGCSYHKMEDQLRQEGQEFLEKRIQGAEGSEEAGITGGSSETEGTDGFGQATDNSAIDSASQAGSMETASFTEDGTDGKSLPSPILSRATGVEYEVRGCTVYKDWEEAGLSAGDFISSVYDGLTQHVTGKSGRVFVLLDIHAVRRQKHIMRDSWEVSADTNTLCHETIGEDTEPDEIRELAYFSEAAPDADEDTYGFYTLEQDAALEFQAGYFVDPAWLEDGQLFYALDYNSDMQEYMDLGGFLS